MSNDKGEATYHPYYERRPIVPPDLQRRARIARIFRVYIAQADAVLDSPRAAILEVLQHEVLDALEADT